MRHFTTLTIWAIIILVLVCTVAGNHGLLHLFQINNELESLEEKNRALESEIAVIRSDATGLKQNKFVLEEKARELGLSKPGEIVYVYSGNDSAQVKAPNGNSTK